MNKVELLSKFKQFNKPFYTFSDLQLLLGLKKLSANKRIIDLVRQGFLLKLGRNIFVPSFWDFDVIKIANYLNQPAYLSFESALSYHGIYNDNNNIITFATPMKFIDREIAGKSVMWSKINPNLFWGFEKKDNIMIAKKEKALADLIYLMSYGKGDLSEDMINTENIDKKNLNNYINKYPSQTKNYFFEHYPGLADQKSIT